MVKQDPKKVGWYQWGERDVNEERRSVRYG